MCRHASNASPRLHHGARAPRMLTRSVADAPVPALVTVQRRAVKPVCSPSGRSVSIGPSKMPPLAWLGTTSHRKVTCGGQADGGIPMSHTHILAGFLMIRVETSKTRTHRLFDYHSRRYESEITTLKTPSSVGIFHQSEQPESDRSPAKQPSIFNCHRVGKEDGVEREVVTQCAVIENGKHGTDYLWAGKEHVAA